MGRICTASHRKKTAAPKASRRRSRKSSTSIIAFQQTVKAYIDERSERFRRTVDPTRTVAILAYAKLQIPARINLQMISASCLLLSDFQLSEHRSFLRLLAYCLSENG